MELDTLSSSKTTSLNDAIIALCNVAEPVKSQFVAFRRFYHEMTHTDEQTGDISVYSGNPGLASHTAVLRAVDILKYLCNEASGLEAFQQAAFPDCLPKERKAAARITARLAFMIDPSSRDIYSMLYRIENEDAYPVKWLPNQTFIQFFHAAFPTDSEDCWYSNNKCKDLTAWSLRKRLGIVIIPTNDLAEHLVYNPKRKTLAVFHQVEYLKAQVRYTADRSLEESIEMSFANGTLPPQLLFETLYTIYEILFPYVTDDESDALARELTTTNGLDNASDSAFDPNLMVWDGLFRTGQSSSCFEFVYWTKRLRNLQAAVDHPPPSNMVVSWAERHTSERTALTVALIGLFLTALFGLLSFLVGIAQLVVSLEQNKLGS
ncbi:hypothetical protein J3F84DRAFT_379934 [Trichoderma pleuroticola]